jgi:hypothetical protein
MSTPVPQLYPLTKADLAGDALKIHWSDVGATTYLLYRDEEPITNIEGWFPYAVIDRGQTEFLDHNLTNGATVYYAVQAVQNGQKSALSNSVRFKVQFPEHLVLQKEQIKEAAYFESKNTPQYDQKVWKYAQAILTLEKSFPQRSIEYLENHVRSLKQDVPEFAGMLYEPTEAEIRMQAKKIYESHPDPMELDWKLSEALLIIKKMQELIEFEIKIR